MKDHNFKVKGLANFPVGIAGHIEGRGNFENLPILLVFTVSDFDKLNNFGFLFFFKVACLSNPLEA